MDHYVQRSHSKNMLPTLVDHMQAKQALAGDHGSFEVLMKKYEQALRCYIKGILKDPELTADVLQSVFFQLYVSLPNLRTNLPLNAWLYRVAYNRCVDELRKNARRRAVPFSLLQGEDNEDEHALLEMLPDTLLTPEEVLEQLELHEQLAHAVETLSQPFRAVVSLRCFRGLSFSEIAEKLNIPASTAKTYYHRSLPRLRAALQEKIS
ncbi:RNA polymerase sigma factor [Reticulibacter mediterranei]|uniref:RNA polymerase sigma factor n=1 Tax=Reticulibacter mediterranei TaxID=2778369 RepID=A0A8J3IG68_9CHLR|nr:RNA polymerase sigma factor [Reticulibacter mediterranei]GHO94874.1 RNA polymerase sigma factor [Reticulibacter mediterranei]